MRSIDVAPMTGTGEMEPDNVIDLDPRAEVRFLNDDEDFGLVLADGHIEVVMSLPRHPDAARLVRSLAARIEQLEPKIRAATIGYEHGPLTGPGPWPRP